MGYQIQKIKKKSSHTSDTDPDSCAMVIHSVVAKHGKGCDPGINQYTWCKTKDGRYSNMYSLVLYHLVH